MNLLQRIFEIDAFRFGSPQWLWLLLLVPILLLLDRKRGTAGTITLPTLSVLASLGVRPRRFIGALSQIFTVLAVIGATVALARPQAVREIKGESSSGIDIMLTIDVSRSMIMSDMRIASRSVQRITAAKKVASEFIKLRPSDRIGIVAFAGQPYSVSPITLDHRYLQEALSDIRLGDIEDQGTVIGTALAASALALNQRDSASKVIVLVTDGKSEPGKITPIDAAEEAAKLGIKIYTIAIGTEDGRLSRDSGQIGQQFDVETLQAIAAATGGEFYRARSTQDLDNVFLTINDLEKSEVEQEVTLIPTEIYHWPAIASLLVGLVAAALCAVFPPPAP